MRDEAKARVEHQEWSSGEDGRCGAVAGADRSMLLKTRTRGDDQGSKVWLISIEQDEQWYCKL